MKTTVISLVVKGSQNTRTKIYNGPVSMKSISKHIIPKNVANFTKV